MPWIGCSPTPAGLLAEQLDGIIASTAIAGVKVGLLFDPAQVEVVAERVADGRLPAPVVDPVMVDGRGDRFVAADIEVGGPCAPVSARGGPHARTRPRPDCSGATPAALAALGAGLVVVTGGGAEATDLLVWPDGSTAGAARASGSRRRTCGGAGARSRRRWRPGLARGDDVGSGRPPGEGVCRRARCGTVHDWTVGPPGSAGPVSHRR